jgi:hypothetical protein
MGILESSGLGYMIERGAILRKAVGLVEEIRPQTSLAVEVDMVRLLGRLPTMRKDIADGVTSFFSWEKGRELTTKKREIPEMTNQGTDISNQMEG